MAKQDYEGGCHCGAVRYRAALDLEQPVVVCNCSHCQIKGLMLSFTPVAEFAVTKGEDQLTEYRFNKKKLAHLFCKVCGVQGFARGTGPGGAEMAAVNVRTVDGVDINALPIKEVNGREF